MESQHTPPLVSRPRLVVLDTSHLANLAADAASTDSDRRRSAQHFVPNIADHGWVPLLCWHQLDELLQHGDDDMVDARLRYLRGLPLVAWVAASSAATGPGSIVDVLAAEVTAALARPDGDAIEVRDLSREHLMCFGSGSEAIPECLREWRLLRSALADRQERSRKVAAISKWSTAQIANTRISSWVRGEPRKSHDVERSLTDAREALAQEISTRGDKRITDPCAMAREFMDEVEQLGEQVTAIDSESPAVAALLAAGLEHDDIDLDATFEATMDLVIFRNRLRLVADSCGLSWPEVKAKVKQDQLPVILIERSMRAYAQDQPERKGSDLTDVHLLCLSPYADMTYVDKRTLESVGRIRRQDQVVNRILGNVGKASAYPQIYRQLARGA